MRMSYIDNFMAGATGVVAIAIVVTLVLALLGDSIGDVELPEDLFY